MSGTPRGSLTVDPPRGRRQADGHVRGNECVSDQRDRQERDEPHATSAEVLVDDVGHDEDDRPQEHTGGEGKRAGLPEEAPAEGRLPSVVSSAKILTPTNSAMIAFATKKPASTTKSRAARPPRAGLMAGDS